MSNKTHLRTATLEWHRGFPDKAGMYLVELTTGDHVVTPYVIPGQEGVDTWGDKRGSGWACLTHSHATVFAWAAIPLARAALAQASGQ